MYIGVMPHPDSQHNNKNSRTYFEQAAFVTPCILEEACKKDRPFILFIPEELDGLTPVDRNSPLIEGARVALTWASVYHRFNNVDTKVILLPSCNNDQNSTDLAFQYVQSSLHFLPQRNCIASPEQSMERRIVKTKSLKQFRSIPLKLEPYYPVISEERSLFLTPTLHENPKKKRAVITGASGFLGSYLCKELLKLGYQIIALDDLSCCTGENIESLKNNPNFSFHLIDVSHPFDVAGPIDAVLHFASVPSPVQYYAKPIETLRSGLHATKETLELAKKKNALFLFASTSEVYGDPKEHPQTEQYPGNVNPIGKRSQYDESKRGAETLIKLYFEQYGMDVRIARIFNTFGPNMQLSDGRVITNFIQATLTNTPMIIHGDGQQTRSPAYVSDTIEGIIRILETKEIGNFPAIEQRIFNVGAQEEYSINVIASLVNQIAQKHLGRRVPIEHIPHFDTTDPQVRQPDITYLSKTTQFKIKTSFKEGLEKTFLHYYKTEGTRNL